jgi:hypothetical protein
VKKPVSKFAFQTQPAALHRGGGGSGGGFGGFGFAPTTSTPVLAGLYKFARIQLTHSLQAPDDPTLEPPEVRKTGFSSKLGFQIFNLYRYGALHVESS